MAVGFSTTKGTGWNSGHTSSGPVSINLPSNAADGTLTLGCGGVYGNTSGGDFTTVTETKTALYNAANVSICTYDGWYIESGTPDTAESIRARSTTGLNTQGFWFSLTDFDTGTPIRVAPTINSGVGSLMTYPAATGAKDGDIALRVAFWIRDRTTSAGITGFTLLEENTAPTAGSQDVSSYAAYRTISTDEDIASANQNRSGNGRWFAMTIVIATAAGGTINTKTLSDEIAVSEVSEPERDVTREQLDTMVVAEAIKRAILAYRIQSDDAAVTDTAEGVSVRQRLSEDSAAALDQAITHLKRIRALSESAEVADAVIAQLTYIRDKTLSDDISLLDFLKIDREVRRQVLDSLTIDDSLEAQQIRARLLADTLATVDTKIDRRLVWRDLIDVLDIEDAIEPERLRDRLLQNDIEAADATLISRSRYKRNTLLGNWARVLDAKVIDRLRQRTTVDPAEVEDAIDHYRVAWRVSQDFAAVVDSYIKQIISDEGAIVEKALADLLDTADTAIPLRRFYRTVLDSADVSDAIIKEIISSLVTFRTLADPSEVQDLALVSRERHKRNTLLGNWARVLDAKVIDRLRYRDLSDTADVGDDLERKKIASRFLADTADLADQAEILRLGYRALLDNAESTDQIESRRSFFRVRDDSADVIDSITSQVIQGFIDQLLDTIRVADKAIARLILANFPDFYIRTGVRRP